MNKHWIIGMAFLLSLSAYADRDRVDSLLNLLPSVEDSVRIDVLEKLIVAHEDMSNDSVVLFGQQMLDYARTKRNVSGTARAMLYLGKAYHGKGLDDEALVFLYKARDMFDASKDQRGLGLAYTFIGAIQENQGRHDKALGYYFKALKIFEDTDDLDGKANVFNNMGNLHQKQYNYREALKFYTRSMDMYKKLGKRDKVAALLNNAATAHNSLNEVDKAMELNFEALRTYERTENVRGIGTVANNIGVIYCQKGLYRDAMKYFKQALGMARKVGDQNLIAGALCNMGEAQIYLGNYIASMQYFDEGIELNKRLRNENQLVGAYEGLTLLYEETGQVDKALETYKKAAAIKERLLDDERSRTMAELQANYESEQKEKEIAYQMLVIDKQKSENRFLTVLMLLAAMLLLAVIYGYFRIRKNSRELEKLSIVASKTHNGVMIYDKEGKVEYINDGFVSLSGYSVDEIIKEKGSTIQKISSNPDIEHVLEKVLTSKIPLSYVAMTKAKDGRKLWISTTLSPVFNEKGEVQKIVAIDTDFTESKRKSEEIEKSIAYAKKIQEAILPMRNQIALAFPESFILYRPKAVVSGDFYWYAEKNGYKYIAVADCTGHGVPGAFMSVLGSNAMNQIIRREEFDDPATILNALHRAIRKSLKQDIEGSESREGMDISLCRVDQANGTLLYAGANRPLFLTRKGKLHETAPDKFPIGGYQSETERRFTQHEIRYEKGDMIYLFTDGYPDQFGGPKGKKFMNKRFRELVLSMNGSLPDVQRKAVEDRFLDWKGSEEQIDDILVIGIRL
ncbi:MAG: tetratricopeptide repeat protein [Flavobacteriales bacterium]|nr:tetratricopeptide repeat protein [Flavobacteriales bacterium]